MEEQSITRLILPLSGTILKYIKKKKKNKHNRKLTVSRKQTAPFAVLTELPSLRVVEVTSSFTRTGRQEKCYNFILLLKSVSRLQL